MAAVLTSLTLLSLGAAVVSTPRHADGSPVTRSERTPWGDLAALAGWRY